MLLVCIVSPFSREHGATAGSTVVNPACGNLNRERGYIAIPVPAWKFGLARQIRPSRPASAYSFEGTWCLLLTGFLPLSAMASTYIYTLTHYRGSLEFIGTRIAYGWWLLSTECSETRPVALSVVPATGASFSGFTMDQFLCASLSPHLLQVLVCCGFQRKI